MNLQDQLEAVENSIEFWEDEYITQHKFGKIKKLPGLQTEIDKWQAHKEDLLKEIEIEGLVDEYFEGAKIGARQCGK